MITKTQITNMFKKLLGFIGSILDNIFIMVFLTSVTTFASNIFYDFVVNTKPFVLYLHEIFPSNIAGYIFNFFFSFNQITGITGLRYFSFYWDIVNKDVAKIFIVLGVSTVLTLIVIYFVQNRTNKILSNTKRRIINLIVAIISTNIFALIWFITHAFTFGLEL